MTQGKTRVEGLPPSARMQKRGDFLRCQSSGKRLYSQHTLLVHQANGRAVDRLGLVVTKRTGNAVVRNRWKRVIRDTFRKIRLEGTVREDWVVSVKRTVQGPPPAGFAQELKQLWKRATA